MKATLVVKACEQKHRHTDSVQYNNAGMGDYVLTTQVISLFSDGSAGAAKRRVESPPDVTVLPHLSAAEDLSAVACVTHKEHEPLQLAKSAGVLCVCPSSGLIVLLREIFGCESLSQRYFALSEAKCLLPEAVLCVHDDACHLLKYAERRKQDCDVQNALHAPTCFLV